jgi:transcription antitermination factor NusG
MSTVDTEQERTGWFAVQVRSRWELSTARLLSGKGYETLLPLHQSRRYWSGRARAVEVPLFPGYVFCRFDVLKRLPILITPGVQSVVSRGRVPVPVEVSEIAAIQKIVSSGAQAEPWPYLELGERVRVEEGALRGMEGILVSFKSGHRVVVSVSLLHRSVALEIDRLLVKPIREIRGASQGRCAPGDLRQEVLV